MVKRNGLRKSLLRVVPFSNAEVSLLPNSAGRRRSLRLFVRLARRTAVFESRQVSLPIRAQVLLAWLQVIGDIRSAPTRDKLAFQIVCDRGQSFNLLLQIAHKVFHSFAVKTDFGLEQLGLSLLNGSLGFHLLLVTTCLLHRSASSLLVLHGLWWGHNYQDRDKG